VDHAARAILESLPAKPRRSKLEPQAALIRALRRRGRTYREIVTILREQCGITVAVHTLHHFVRVQARTAGSFRTRTRTRAARPKPPKPVAKPSVPEATADVRRRIAALKTRETPAARAEPKAFAYDDTEPLQLIRPRPEKE
jgi:hypothetical protein